MIHRLDEVGSTQDEARARFDDRVPAVVVAARQLQGRGRTGNEWVHAPRATAASVAMRVDWPEDDLGLIPLLAGMAARAAVIETGARSLMLKWPNDLMLGEDKVGGVLVEAAQGVLVTGCGINVWWPDPPHGVGAILDDDPGQEATFGLATTWAIHFLDAVAAGPQAWNRETYAAACATLGRDVEWSPTGRGRAVGIASNGGLIVETPGGAVTLRSGEVRLIRPTTLGPTDDVERGAEPA